MPKNIQTTRIHGGSYIAYSDASPKFCFEAASEKEAVETAVRALVFYEGSKSTKV